MAEKGHPCPSQYLNLFVNMLAVECWRKCLLNSGLPSSRAADLESPCSTAGSDVIEGERIMDR